MKVDDVFDSTLWADLFDRRKFSRTKMGRQGRISFRAQQKPIECNVRDISNVGAGLRADGLDVLPVNFELSFDNFRTVHECHLVWREGNLLGVAFHS